MSQEWEKKQNFELAARVPLLIHVPWKPKAIGATTEATVELVDIFPSLTALVNLPTPPGLQGQGTDLSPLFDEPRLGASFKNRSFTVYPVCTAPGAAARDYPEGSHSPMHAGSHGCVFGGSQTDRHYFKMGYSLRTDKFRYTAWIPWNRSNLVGIWNSSIALWPTDGANLINRELYDHTGDDGSDPDGFENENLADDPAYEAIVAELHEVLHLHNVECEQCCAKDAKQCVDKPHSQPHCRGESGVCQCADTPSQSFGFGPHDSSSISVSNDSAVATWSDHACDTVALITTIAQPPLTQAAPVLASF